MKNIKVSVVVPIYNVEEYLRECVDSILAQTLQEIEIILVDDGSPDKCGQIVDEYAKKDKRIVAIHQENGGYGKAVNAGMKIAKGEYIGIVESDDWIEPEMYEKLYAKAKKYDADVSKGSFYVYNPMPEKGKKVQTLYSEHPDELFPCPDDAFSLKDYPKIIMSHASIWSMIYKREWLQKNKLQIIETEGSAYQDFLFMVQVMANAQRIAVVKEPLYNWRSEREGNSTGQRGEKLLMMPVMNKMALQVLHDKKLLDICKEEIYYHIYRTNIGGLKDSQWQIKGKLFDLLYDIFKPLKNDKQFSFKYFDYLEKKVVKKIWENNLLNALKISYGINLQVWRRSLVSKRLPSDFGGDWQICLLGVQIGSRFDYNLHTWGYIKLGKMKANYG